eukprot:297578-Prorocentrum_minimum.AAC.1
MADPILICASRIDRIAFPNRIPINPTPTRFACALNVQTFLGFARLALDRYEFCNFLSLSPSSSLIFLPLTIPREQVSCCLEQFEVKEVVGLQREKER